MVEELVRRYPGRNSQIYVLLNVYKEPPFPDTVFVYGVSGVGKSSILSATLDVCGIRPVLVNLIECYSSKILFESILNQLWSRRIDDAGVSKPFARCDNMMDFVSSLRKIDDAVDLKRCPIILDKAEELRNMDLNLLPSFLRLRELCRVDVCVILVSQLPFQKFYTRTNLVEPIKINFPQYHKEELCEILNLEYYNLKKNELDINVYKNFINVLISTFYRACRDVVELKSMAKIDFPVYCKPILDGSIMASDSMSLWKNIAPTLKKSLENLYVKISRKNVSLVEIENLSAGNLTQTLELPFYAKFLLIAAYLASYNPAKDDKRLFMKYHGKKRKTMTDVKAKSKVSEQLSTQLGPKPFSFDRLIAIFYAILENKVNFNNNLLVQVSTLVELQLLTSTSDTCNLDGQKYKCAVGLDFIQSVSKMVGFNIRKYLTDFSYM
ncbi:origin recognition complex subunit 5 [Onthophagus taurus]|uniref:origin recognition complex subunit 5 n=1 Tax=Onthophagus taurus TaxID=166361 RepID=UPI0039BEC5F0